MSRDSKSVRCVNLSEQLENRRLLAASYDPRASLSMPELSSLPRINAIDATTPMARKMPAPTTTGGSATLRSYGPESVVLQVHGTADADTIQVEMDGASVKATINGTEFIFSDAEVTSIWIEGFAGADSIDLESNGDNPTSFFGDEGDDNMNLSFVSGNLGGITSPVQVSGGDDQDTLNVWDDFDNGGSEYFFTDTAFSGAEFSTIDFSTIEIAQLAADKGDNFVTVSNDSALVQNVMGGPGADTIIVSDSITPVRLFGEAGLDTFLIDSDNFGPNAVAVVPVSDDTQQFTIGIASTLFLADGITLTAFRENMAGALSFGHRSTYIAFAGTMPLPLSSARAVTNAGYNGGDWNGTVLAFSSDYSASSAAGDGIGYARATDLAISEYNGVSLGANDVIFTQTLYGDTDLNHTVNFADLLTVAQNYDLGSKFWFHGDFDYNQLVSFPDLLRIAQNYGMSSGTRSARGGMTDTILRQSENISIV